MRMHVIQLRCPCSALDITVHRPDNCSQSVSKPHPDQTSEDGSGERRPEEDEHAAGHPPEADVELRVTQVLAGNHLPSNGMLIPRM